jgi:hypothetical protein
MGKGKKKSKLRHGSTYELDAKVQRVYAAYISQIVTQPVSQYSYDIFKVKEDIEFKTKPALQKIQKMVIPDDEDAFNDFSSKLADKYKQIERSIVPGVFFVILLTHKGKRYISILKLDWVSESWTEFDEKTSKMTLHEVLEELPGPNRFRKGAVFPHPISPKSSYMKVFQKDHPADYFDEFLGGRPRTTAYDVMTKMRSLSRRITGDWPSYDQQIGLYDGLKAFVGDDKKSMKMEVAKEIMKSALPTEVSKVKEVVESDWDLRGLIKASEVDDLIIEFTVGGIKLRGHHREFTERFQAKIGGDPEKHRITGPLGNTRHVEK